MGRLDETRLTTARETAAPLLVTGHEGPITAVAINVDGARIVAGGNDGSVMMWDSATGAQLLSHDGFDDRVGDVAITGESLVAASEGGATGRVWTWDVNSGKMGRRYRCDAPVAFALLGAEGRRCVELCEGTIRLLQVPPPPGDPPIRSLAMETASPTAMGITPDAGRVVVGSEEGHLRVIDLPQGETGLHVDCGERIHAVGLSPDGALALSADEDRSIRVWDCDGGHHVRALQGHEAPVDVLVVSGDGSRVASAAADGSLRLWDLATGRLLSTIRGQVRVTACAFGHDDASVLVGAADGSVLLLPRAWIDSAANLEFPTGAEPAAPAPQATILVGAGGTTEAEEDEERDDDGTEVQQALERLLRGVALRTAEIEMADARDLYRAGDYRGALAALEELDERIRQDPLWITFHDYLLALAPSGRRKARTPVDVEPEGSRLDLDRLHFLLVDEEMDEAKKLVEDDRFVEAEPVVDKALAMAPSFPFANFLKAVCAHRRLGEEVASSSPPPIESLVEELANALRHAEIGATDSDIEAAPALVDTIRTDLERFEMIARRTGAKVGMKRVEALTERLGSIMKLVGSGISSPDHFREVREAMQALRVQVDELMPQLANSEAEEALHELKGTVDRHLRRLDVVGEEIETGQIVEALMEEFSAIQNDTEGDESPKEMEDRLISLRDRVGEARRRVPDGDATDVLDQLEGAITRNLEQLAAAAEVGPLVERYEAVMDSAKKGISTPAEARLLITKLQRLRSDVRKVADKSPVARSTLGGLVSAIDRNLEQIEEATAVPPEIEELNALARRFKNLVEEAQKQGIDKKRHRDKLKKDLGSLQKQVDALSRRASAVDVRRAIAELSGAIDNVKMQLW